MLFFIVIAPSMLMSLYNKLCLRLSIQLPPTLVLPSRYMQPTQFCSEYIPHHPFPMSHIFILAPWNGSQIPLTLSLILVTGLPVFLFFSPVLFRNISAFSLTSSICMFLTHIDRSVPLMYCAMMTGCRRGRGLTEISICGLFFAKVGSEDFMNEFMPREEPHQLQ
jgi:hypothetical protein